MLYNNKTKKNKIERNLRNGCTVVQGIGLRDIIRIRQEKGIQYTKPHMDNHVYR